MKLTPYLPYLYFLRFRYHQFSKSVPYLCTPLYIYVLYAKSSPVKYVQNKTKCALSRAHLERKVHANSTLKLLTANYIFQLKSRVIWHLASCLLLLSNIDTSWRIIFWIDDHIRPKHESEPIESEPKCQPCRSQLPTRDAAKNHPHWISKPCRSKFDLERCS